MKIENIGNKVFVTSEYNTDFIREAKRLGGKWAVDEKAWVFNSTLIDDVNQLCLDCYGENGEGVGETVTLRLTFNESCLAEKSSYTLAGRQIARATGRDSGATLGDNIVSRKGRYGSGGSRNNWYTEISEGAVLDILDFPKCLVEKLKDEAEGEGIAVEILDTHTNQITLEKEKNTLLARLTEIESLLSDA